MRSLLFLLFFICVLEAQSQAIKLNGSYSGAGINSFIGQRSWFLNDSDFTIRNSWSAGVDFRIANFSAGRIYLGLEYQSLRQLEFHRNSDPLYSSSVVISGRYGIAGIPLSFSTGNDSSRWSYSIRVTPSVSVYNNIVCESCGEKTGAGFWSQHLYFVVPVQIQAMRKMNFGSHYSIEAGPFLKYLAYNNSVYYPLQSLFGGIQIQAGWRR